MEPFVFYVNLLAIAIGGALGSVARYGFATLVYRVTSPVFPFGTFAVNVAGCVLFGLIIGLADHRVALTPAARAFLLIGLLGGFTTFSTYAFESVQLLRDGEWMFATLNMGGQVVAGVAGLWAGAAIGGQL